MYLTRLTRHAPIVDPTRRPAIVRKTSWPATDRVQITLDGKIVATSKNLRGVLDYGRAHGVKRVYVHKIVDKNTTHDALVVFVFGDSALSVTLWASFGVACQWILDRRSWDLSAARGYNGNARLYD